MKTHPFFVYDFQIEPVILCILYAFMSSTVSERLTKNGRSAVCFEIITDYPEELSRDIIEKLHHSCTLIPARGMYSGRETNMLICVVNKTQVAAVSRIIRKYPNTFAVMDPVSEVMGNFKRMNSDGAEEIKLLDDGDGYCSFHAYKLEITHVSLKPSADALGFKAQLFGDGAVQAAVTGFGYTLSAGYQALTRTGSGNPNNGSFSLRLQNIMAAGGGEKEITAYAFVTVQGQTLKTQIQTTSMKATIVAVNDLWSSLDATQQAAVRELYNRYSTVMAAWLEGKTNHIAG